MFDPSHIGTIVRYMGHEVRIASVLADQTRATGLLQEKLPNGKATLDWDEQAFSTLRGWPATVTVYQSRLVIGGSRSLPDWVWLSKSGAYFNFDLGTGLDDEAIAFRLGSGYGTDELHTVQALQPTQPLQVFTTAGEWVVRGVPLTPDGVQLELQTRVGSWTGRRLQPVDVDGATLFLGASGRELREFLYVLTEQAYQSADIALLARHLLVEPADMGFAGQRRLLLILRADGKAAAVTIDRNVNVVAWSLLETAGSLAALTVHEGELWFLVAAGGGVFLERLDDSLGVDHARTLSSPAATAVWTGLDEYEGQVVVATTAEGDLVRATVSLGHRHAAAADRRPDRRTAVHADGGADAGRHTERRGCQPGPRLPPCPRQLPRPRDCRPQRRPRRRGPAGPARAGQRQHARLHGRRGPARHGLASGHGPAALARRAGRPTAGDDPFRDHRDQGERLMGAYSSLATLGLNLALSQAAQRSRSDQLGKQEDQQASDILASDAATRQQQASDLAQRMAAERARLGAAGVGTTGGSADAVLSGLQDQGDLAQQALDAQTTSRLDQVQQSFDQRQRSNLLDFSNQWLGVGSSLLGGQGRSLLD